MKLFIISLCMGLTATFLGAQEGPKEEKKIKREVRVLVVGERPMPKYEKKGEMFVEVNPDDKLIPPSMMEVAKSEKDKEREKDTKKEPQIFGFTMNQIVRVSNYEGESTLRLILKNPLVKGLKDVVIEAKLDKMVHPLVVISSDRAGSGWLTPRVQVVDVSEQTLPVGSVLVISQTKWPLRMDYGGQKQELTTGIKCVSPKKVVKDLVDIKLEMKSGDQYLTVCNNQYMFGERDRVVMYVDDAQAVTKNVPPLFIRYTVDSADVDQKKAE